ncbi:hypothetical protein M1403_01540 [Patescibacteria group bacterium]|nr:hypothetical protein [Patescibacteria group bacterium]
MEERARQAAAIIVGIILLVLVVLLARWTGERIRERFLTPKPPVVTSTPPEENTESATPSSLLNNGGSKTSTVSAIPSTGPEDFGYLVMGLVLVSGLSSLALAHKPQ